MLTTHNNQTTFMVQPTTKRNRLLETIGNTPLVKLNNIVKNKNVSVYAKLEGQNPGGSVKDRTALFMIEGAEKRGELTPGKTIIEATSGNMGIALSMIAAQKGYAITIVMSEGMSQERRIILKTLGAELILTDKQFGTEGALNRAQQMVAENPKKYWFANQFNNPDNVLAHYATTGTEIIRDVGAVDYVFAGLATCGTVMGIAKRFKEDSPTTKVIGVIPPHGYKVQGMQNPELDFKGALYTPELLSEIRQVEVEDAYATAKQVAKEEGMFVGMSSGAALCAALRQAEVMPSGNIVVIFPDRGEKYVSTPLFQ